MGAWIAERCLVDPHATEKQIDLWASWQSWAIANNLAEARKAPEVIIISEYSAQWKMITNRENG
jgi:hypothetical protein